MKLLIIGAHSEYAIERFYLKYWKEYGKNITIEFFPAQNFFYKYYNKNLVNKIVFKFGISSIYEKINRELITNIEYFQPDIIFVFKGMEISAETLKYAKKKNIKLINYNPDNPFVFSGNGSGNSNITNSIGVYDVHFTYNSLIKTQLEEKFNIPTYILPFAFDISEDEFEICKMESEINKVCFIGNPDTERAKLILGIANSGIQIDLFGHNWIKFIKHNNVNCFDTVYGIQFWKNLRKYRVQLNIMRPHNLNSHNMRTFEIAGIGGIQLAPDTTEHRSFFENGKEIYLYKNMEECILNISSLLNMSKQEACKIRENARFKSIVSNYSYRDRSIQVLNIINGL